MLKVGDVFNRNELAARHRRAPSELSEPDHYGLQIPFFSFEGWVLYRASDVFPLCQRQ
jgi:hypothetical protein